MLIHKFTSFVLLLAAAVPLAAQIPLWTPARCSSGPGSSFGITAYQCASCGFNYENGQRPVYTFFAEPTVTGVERSSTVEKGDVVEAVDSLPITTHAGADRFAYPSSGKHTLTVRRGRERKDLPVSVPRVCYSVGWGGLGIGSGTSTGSSASVGSGTASGAAAGTSGGFGRGDDGVRAGAGTGTGTGVGRGVPVIGGEPIYIVDGVRIDPSDTKPETGKFGFAVECRPSCALKKTPDGRYYYQYDAYPRIIEIRDRSAADRAGLRVGDIVLKVEGRSILSEDVLQGLESRDQVRITVRRDGKDIDVLMLVTRS